MKTPKLPSNGNQAASMKINRNVNRIWHTFVTLNLKKKLPKSEKKRSLLGDVCRNLSIVSKAMQVPNRQRPVRNIILNIGPRRPDRLNINNSNSTITKGKAMSVCRPTNSAERTFWLNEAKVPSLNSDVSHIGILRMQLRRKMRNTRDDREMIVDICRY